MVQYNFLISEKLIFLTIKYEGAIHNDSNQSMGIAPSL